MLDGIVGHRVKLLAALLWLGVALGLGSPPGAAAHGDAEPWVFVPADQVEQGQLFTVVGADMRPGVLVTLDLASYGEVTSLGTVAPAEDGHFEASLSVPTTVRDGYAELRAIDSAGLAASTWVLVGEEVDLSVAGAPAGADPWWADPSVLVLGGFIVGGALVLARLLFRSRSPQRAPVAAGHRVRPVPRKSSKERRRGR